MIHDKLCLRCDIRFQTVYNAQKYCSKTCSYEATLERSRVYARSKKNDVREKQKQKFMEEKGIKAWEFLNEIGEKQEEKFIKRKTCCKACKITEGETRLLTHHITYIPVETVILCHKCHATLHHNILNGKKFSNNIVID